MKTRIMITTAVLALSLVGCGSDKPADKGESPSNTCYDQQDKAVKDWNVYVDEWNKLTQARDAKGEKVVTVDGVQYENYASYATAKGYPLKYVAPECLEK